MGVHGTYCQLCGLPMNHDHYVQQRGGYGFKIYRGPDSHEWEDDEHPFSFTPEHAWLERGSAVSLDPETPPVVHGAVSDGTIEDVGTGTRLLVLAGDEDGRAYHTSCWRELGEPAQIDDAPTAAGTLAYAVLAPYQQQLFAFDQLARDGMSWMLADPDAATADGQRSRARILAAAFVAKSVHAQPFVSETKPTTVAHLLARRGSWQGQIFEDDHGKKRSLIRYRADVTPDVDVRGYPEMV
ncbi:MAG: hypothetical protein H0T42_20870, partial [Deltaproteobacteria bacterium]|nr:hypothetical protein [Deltaproteobacteria bacterium]